MGSEQQIEIEDIFTSQKKSSSALQTSSTPLTLSTPPTLPFPSTHLTPPCDEAAGCVESRMMNKLLEFKVIWETSAKTDSDRIKHLEEQVLSLQSVKREFIHDGINIIK